MFEFTVDIPTDYREPSFDLYTVDTILTRAGVVFTNYQENLQEGTVSFSAPNTREYIFQALNHTPYVLR